MSCLKFRLKTIAEIGLSQGLDYEKIPYLTYLRSKSVSHMITAKKKNNSVPRMYVRWTDIEKMSISVGKLAGM